MDTRIEVLAEVILDRAKLNADLFAEGRNRGDKYHAYRRIENLCRDMLGVLEEYRRDHPEEYASAEPFHTTIRG